MGAAFLVVGRFALLRSCFELQEQYRYYSSLGVAPLLIVAGLLWVVRPSAFVGQGRPRRTVVVVALIAGLAVSIFFTRWFVSAVLGADAQPAGWF